MKSILEKIKHWFITLWNSVVSWCTAVWRFVSHIWHRREVIGTEMKHKQRFVVMDSVTFKEKWAFQLSAINLFVFIGISMILLIVLTTILIAFTPLREFIPGYANQKMTEQTYQNAIAVDSLAMKLEAQDRMLADMKDLMMGVDPELRAKAADSVRRSQQPVSDKGGQEYRHSSADSLLRKEVEEQDQYSVKNKSAATSSQTTPSILLFTPLKGKVIAGFDNKTRHYGVDISGVENATIKSVAPGTVVFASYTIESGYVIGVLHAGGMMSVYKHNNNLLKHEGDVVRAGEPIAYLGNAVDATSGAHLHFELWVGGKPVNPLIYISF